MNVFISHSNETKDLVPALAELLRSAKHDVWTPSEIRVGDELHSSISAAVKKSDVMLVLIGDDITPWIYYELGMAQGFGLKVLIVSTGTTQITGPIALLPRVQWRDDDPSAYIQIAKALNEMGVTSDISYLQFETASAMLTAASKNRRMMEALNAFEFEEKLAQLFRERGYRVTRTKEGADSGVDFVIESDKDSMLCLVEAKKYSSNSRVSVDAVRRLLATLESTNATHGLLVSTGSFTSSALALAANTRLRLKTVEEVLSASSTKELLTPSSIHTSE